MIELKKGILSFVGPANSGKTTFVLRLVNENRGMIDFARSVTTKPITELGLNEKNFTSVSEKEFKNRIRNHEFFEYVESTDSQDGLYYYGTPKSEIERINDSNKFIVLDQDLLGMFAVKECYPETAVSFYLFNNRNSRHLLILEKGEIKDPGELTARLDKGYIQDKTAEHSKTYGMLLDFKIETGEGRYDQAFEFISQKVAYFIKYKKIDKFIKGKAQKIGFKRIMIP